MCHPNWELFLRELAFALLLASIFGSTVELVQRREFIRLVTEERDELKRDVFLYAYGFNLPDQIREEIRSKVLNTNFYRRDLTLDWEFSLPHEDGLVRVKKHYAYTLINNNDDPASWPFRFVQIGADEPKGAMQSTFHSLRVRRSSGKIDEFKLEAENQGGPHQRAFQTSINMAGHEEVWINYEITHVRRIAGDDNYSSRDMIVGLTRIKLRFPRNSRFEASASCKQKSLIQAPDGDPPYLYSFELTEGMFPHQAVVIGWSKIDGGKEEQRDNSN
jgi:hypothetical protein